MSSEINGQRRILITGMTAQQSRLQSHHRSATFAGLLRDALRSQHHEVVMEAPSIHWTKDFLDSFDKVIIGVAAPTSLASNYSFVALDLISRMWETHRLELFVDTSETWLVNAGLKASLDPSVLFKPYFQSRAGYREAMSSEAMRFRITNGLDRLVTREWPQTYVPENPLSSSTVLAQGLSDLARPSVKGINLDAFIPPALVEDGYSPASEKTQRWISLPGDRSWIPKQHCGLPVVDALPRTKAFNDAAFVEMVADSIGLLVPPGRRSIPWSPRVRMALSVGTPVASKWEYLSYLGDSWQQLASVIESLTPWQRAKLASDQLAVYDSWSLDKKRAVAQLTTVTSRQRAASRSLSV